VLGAHIYIRPSGQHNLTVLDDLAQESVDRLSADGFEPCAVVETSPGNLQAWLKHHRTYETSVSTFLAQGIGTPVPGRSQCGGLETVRPSARLYELQAETPAG